MQNYRIQKTYTDDIFIIWVNMINCVKIVKSA